MSLGGSRTSPRKLESNTLFDSPDRGLTGAGKSLRVRHYGSAGILTLKGAATVEGGLKSRTELETGVDSGETLSAILVSLGFAPLFRYEKYREIWRLGGVVICLDETPLGSFVELEGTSAAIHRVARRLAIDSNDFLATSYPALWVSSGHTGDMTFGEKARTRGGLRA